MRLLHRQSRSYLKRSPTVRGWNWGPWLKVSNAYDLIAETLGEEP